MSDALLVEIVVVPLAIAYAALIGTALVQVVRDRALSRLSRDLWILAIVLAPVVGTLACYAVGHRTADALRALDRMRLSL